MIHAWTRSTFGYLFNLNHKRIACHESYTERCGVFEETQLMKLYAISGLGADHRVFDYLSLNLELEVLPWLDQRVVNPSNPTCEEWR